MRTAMAVKQHACLLHATPEHAEQATVCRGNNITAEEFEGSPHCGHLRVHPAQYSTCVSSFLQRALAANGQHKPSLKS